MSLITVAADKSGSREVSTMLFILWVFITGWLLWWLAPTDLDFYREIYSTITTAVFSFGLGAFGVPAVMNRLPSNNPNRAPPPKHDPDRGID